MPPRKADPAGKKAEAVQELSPSALELALPLWNDATALQDSSATGGRPNCFLSSCDITSSVCSYYLYTVFWRKVLMKTCDSAAGIW